jgi:hypothetical protein
MILVIGDISSWETTARSAKFIHSGDDCRRGSFARCALIDIQLSFERSV